MVDFPESWKNLWNDWDIRVFVLTSLLLQIFLIILSPVRKRTAYKSFVLINWSVYLLADWVAIFTLGLLCNNQGNSDFNDAAHHPGGGTKIIKSTGASASRHGATKEYNNKLLAFWAPFMLLHLGGPDTITAFSMEDNELWQRHLVGLLFEVGAAVYVFLLSIPKNSLIAPTVLMFVAGLIKYGERTYALYRGSLDGFLKSMLKEPHPGPIYEKLMDEYQDKLDSGVPARIKITEEPKDTKQSSAKTNNEIQRQEQQTVDDNKQAGEVKRIQEAHKFFGKFKALIVEHLELTFRYRELIENQKAFWQKPAQEAFRVIEYELNFLYEVLFTKAVVTHNRYGYVLRAICSCSIMAAFLSFFFLSKKHNFSTLDKAITYTLLVGAISLDALGFIMLILSDWTVVKLQSRFGMISGLLANIPPRNRWSATVPQHNLISYCIPASEESYMKRIKDRPTILGKLDEIFCIQRALRWMDIGAHFMDEMQYIWHEDVTDTLKEFIFEDLRKEAEWVSSDKEIRHISLSRGEWALSERGYFGEFGNSVEVEFDESLLIWHIATDLCYYTPEDMGKEVEKSKEQRSREDIETGNEKKSNKDDVSVPIKASEHRKFCKLLSDYLIYLLVMRPFMMSSSAVIGLIRYRDTCAEVKRFFTRRPIKEYSTPQERQWVWCCNLLSVNTSVQPIDVKGDMSKSVLFDACELAKKLKRLEVEKRWEIMSEVWTEMLIYAARRCPGTAHAQALSKGGQLLTSVWFFMSHLRLGEQYSLQVGDARAKLVVDK